MFGLKLFSKSVSQMFDYYRLFSFGNSSGGLDYIHDYLYNTKDTKSCDEDGLRKRPAERAFGR